MRTPTVPLPPRPAAPKSTALGGILWPAVPAGRFVQAMALQVQFEQTQWWSPERLLAHQLLQLQALFLHAWKTVPFYCERLGPVAGLAPGKLTMEHVRELPLLTRADVQDSSDNLVTRSLPKTHGAMFDNRTSGSSGRPVEVKVTGVTALFFTALGLRYHLWHRRDFACKSTAIIAMKPGQDSRRAKAWAPGLLTGPSLALSQSLPATTLLDMVIEEDPDYLRVFPTTLRELLRLSRETGKKPGRLREVRTESEPLDREVREMCEEYWGVPVTDAYSCEEISIMALQCPDHNHLHVQSENCLIEVLDDDGKPCSPGQSGRLVVTSLHNFAMPLIRYEIGDFAEVGEPCPCGRGLPVLNRVAGRVRNLAILPSGEKLAPTFYTEPVLNELPIRQFQFIQKTVYEIEARLAVNRPLSADEEARLANFMNRGFGHEFKYRFVYVDEIPRLPGGKFEVFRCEVES